jgi:DNA polymerase
MLGFMPHPELFRLRALESLLAWWRDAGVEVEPPPAQPAGAPDAKGKKRAASPAPPAARPLPAAAQAAAAKDALAEDAAAIAARCATLDALEAALQSFDHPLRAAARNTVFARGDAGADVMLVGEAPGREEDLEGLPFVGRSGKLLDRMFAEIGLTAEHGLYIANVVYWRPRNNRSPSEEDVALCRPFIARHIALKRPKLLVFAGAIAAQTMLGTTQGITRLRGKWMTYKARGADGDALEIPALPIYHPAYVLRRPIAKREVWTDLLSLEARLAAR